jgi:outer membrane protein assembly factor BamB
VGFTNFGSAAYIGDTYQVTSTAAFDPKSVGLDLVYFTQVNNSNCFAMGKDANGVLQELKFGAAFMGFVNLSPEYKRPFSQPSLITATTKWAATPSEIFYFTSGATVYRYNPLNQEIKPLVTDFGGKNVSMIKVIENGTVLLAGTEGTLYHLDISTGKLGEVLKKIDGIPGAPVDATIRK